MIIKTGRMGLRISTKFLRSRSIIRRYKRFRNKQPEKPRNILNKETQPTVNDKMTDFQRPPHYPGNFPFFGEPSPYQLPSIHPDVPDNLGKYRFEAERRKSFANWPNRFIDPNKLAAAGFYYTGEEDNVRCFECKFQIGKWDVGDDPKFEHQRWSERCRFIRKLSCGNVPIDIDPAHAPPPVPRPRDVCGLYGMDVTQGSTRDFHQQPPPPDFQQISAATLGSLGLGRPVSPQFPEYASYDARLKSFESWPKCIKQTKEQLADAGFYYTGKGDETMCYHCGGGLKDWEPNDDPWEQHALWFSKCCYLLTVKGQEYVDRVKGIDVPPLSTEDTLMLNLPSYIKKVEMTMEPKPKDDVSIDECNPGPSCSQGSRGSGLVANSTALTRCASEQSKRLESSYSNQEALHNDKPCDDGRLCKICYTEELGVVFLPCGHMVACVKCAPSLTICAVCRQPFAMTVRAFIS